MPTNRNRNSSPRMRGVFMPIVASAPIVGSIDPKRFANLLKRSWYLCWLSPNLYDFSEEHQLRAVRSARLSSGTGSLWRAKIRQL
jgi:hypothetical protein